MCWSALQRNRLFMFFIAVRLIMGVIIIFCIKMENVFISVFGLERHAVLFRFVICISRLHTPGAHFFHIAKLLIFAKHCAHLQEVLQEVLIF